jgi:hypothetical protein
MLGGSKGCLVNMVDNVNAIGEVNFYKKWNLKVSQSYGNPWPVTGSSFFFLLSCYIIMGLI